MTVIVGACEGGASWLACDSRATRSDGASIEIAGGAKLRRVGRGIIIGLAGDVGVAQLLWSGVRWPVLRGDRDAVGRTLVKWWQQTVIPAAEEWVDSSAPVAEDGTTPGAGVDVGTVQGLVALDCGQLWELVGGGWVPVEQSAVGSGGDAALGALWLLRSMPAPERLERAVAAASAVVATCGGPCYVMRA